MIKLIKRLSKCVREYKLTSILSAAFVGLEVIMEVLIPLEMSKMIDFGINAGDMAYVTKSGVKLIVFALLAILFGNLAGRAAPSLPAGLQKIFATICTTTSRTSRSRTLINSPPQALLQE